MVAVNTEVALFFEPKLIAIELEPCESNDDDLDLDTQFRAYESQPNITNIDLSIKGGFEFSWLSHRIPSHASTYRDVRVLEVGIEYPKKDVFLFALKRYNMKNSVNYYVTKSRSEKVEGKCTMKDKRCKWKIMTSYQKKIEK
ncbi:hypothetical protein PVK06_026665 [Gossypium arboreum]|uniref:Transposase MuDR plant domain-containing protein n=1 Tax=Gossypium arboreum TaxID=29729 RepID=A0ABR0NYA5_GOSAR|nr:hypothetical protein PVK06_026665 [Gossypium arboreum]